MLDERYLSQLDTHRARLIRAAARLLGGTAEAEDVVQDSYLRALEAGGPPALEVAEAWLTTVMHNLAIDRLRRRGWMQKWLHEVEAQALAPEVPSAEADAALAEETERALHLLATRLDRADGAAVLLREVFEATYAEIAAANGKTEAACRQQLHRALMRLRGDAAADQQAEDEAAFRLYRESLQRRDTRALLAMLQQPAPHACAQRSRSRGSIRAAGNAPTARRRWSRCLPALHRSPGCPHRPACRPCRRAIC